MTEIHGYLSLTSSAQKIDFYAGRPKELTLAIELAVKTLKETEKYND